jgi:hypothetical protein
MAKRSSPGLLQGNVHLALPAAAYRALGTPIVIDAQAFGKLYANPLSLQTFEHDAARRRQSESRRARSWPQGNQAIAPTSFAQMP